MLWSPCFKYKSTVARPDETFAEYDFSSMMNSTLPKLISSPFWSLTDNVIAVLLNEKISNVAFNTSWTPCEVKAFMHATWEE